MSPVHHNPGNPITLRFEQETIVAFSVAALSTYALVPNLQLAFDMGDCPLEAVRLKHVFLTHAHGDHARCLLRHHALRRLLGMQPATYYIPAATEDGFRALATAWHRLEGERKPFTMPQFHPLQPDEEVPLHRQLRARTFAVDHSIASLGYTLFDIRKKLNPEFAGENPVRLANLRRQGISLETETHVPRLTFIGDSTIETLYRQPHIGQSRILFLEVTYLLDEDRTLARERGHTHLHDLVDFITERPEALQNQHIVLKHFSMRYSREQIRLLCQSALPAEFFARCHLLV